MNIKELLESKGYEAAHLDRVVQDAASQLASNANNNGLKGQLYFLTSVCGWGEKEIFEKLEEDSDSVTIYYQWREPVKDEEGREFLQVPWADPSRYEFVFDFMFVTPELAKQGLTDFNVDPEESGEWVLVRVSEEPVKTTQVVMGT